MIRDIEGNRKQIVDKGRMEIGNWMFGNQKLVMDIGKWKLDYFP